MSLSWVMTLCRFADRYQRFFNPEDGDSVFLLILVSTYDFTRHQSPQKYQPKIYFTFMSSFHVISAKNA